MWRYWLAVFGLLCAAVNVGAFTISENGEAKVRIVVGDEASGEEQEAAAELATYLGKLTGGTFEQAAEKEFSQGAAIFVGATRAAEKAGVSAAELDRDGFVIRVADGKLFTVGHDSGATELGVHYFLQWYGGIRWYMPLELGEHIPATPDFSVPDDLNDVQEPDWKSRLWSSVANMDRMWPKRNLCRSRYSFHHNLLRIIKPSAVYEQHPEWFPLLDGKRRPNPGDESHSWQPCFSNQELAEWVAAKIIAHFDATPNATSYSLGINDAGAGSYCQCEACQALDDKAKPEFRGRPNYSNRVFTFMNRVAEITSKKYPDKLLGCLAYANCEEVPSFPVHPNIIPYLTNDRAQWRDAAFRAEDEDLLGRWAQATRQLAVYDYYYGSGYVIPRVYPHISAESIKFCHEVGVRAWYGEIYSNWALDGCKAWVASRLLWDSSLDVDALVDEYYTDFFGAAKEPMKKYWDRCEQIWTEQAGEARWFKGFFDIRQLEMFPRDVCMELRGYLREAERAADMDLVRTRVRFYRDGFRYTDLYSQVYWGNQELSETRIESDADLEIAARKLVRYGGASEQLRSYYENTISQDPLLKPVIPFQERAKTLMGTPVLPTLARMSQWAEMNDASEKLGGPLKELTEQETDVGRMASAYLVMLEEPAKAVEVMPNPGFEADAKTADKPEGIDWNAEGCPPGWSSWIRPGTKGELRWVKEPTHSGQHAVLIEGARGAACYITSVPIQRGDIYVCTAWTMARVGEPENVELKIQWKDKEGKWFGESPAVGDSLRQGETGKWAPLQCMFTAPEGAAFAAVAVLCSRMAEDEFAYFDDCSLKRLAMDEEAPAP